MTTAAAAADRAKLDRRYGWGNTGKPYGEIQGNFDDDGWAPGVDRSPTKRVRNLRQQFRDKKQRRIQ